MATTIKSTYKIYNGIDYDTHYLKTTADQVIESTTKRFVTDTQITGWNGISAAANSYTDGKISALVDTAPGTLDTLNELAQALGDDANFSTTMTTLIGTKSAIGHTHTPVEAGVIDSVTAPTTGQVAVFDGTTGKIKSTGFTIATSVPSGAVFTDTKPGTLTTTSATSLTATTNEALTGAIELHKIAKTGAWADIVGKPTLDNYVSWTIKANSETTGTTITSGAVLDLKQSGATTISRVGGVVTISSVNTTYNNFTACTGAAVGTSGLVPGAAINQQAYYLRGDATWGGAFGGSNGTVAGSVGLVPAPGTTQNGAFLRGDGTWATPHDTTYDVFTSTANGLTPLSGGGTTKYLRADGTWVVPPDTIFSPLALTIQGNGTAATTFDAKAAKTLNIKPGTNITVTATTDAITIANTYSYTHPSGAGNLHIPAGGVANNILKWSAAGTATWAALDGTINGTTFNGFNNIIIPGATVSNTQPTVAQSVIGSIWIDTTAA